MHRSETREAAQAPYSDMTMDELQALWPTVYLGFATPPSSLRDWFMFRLGQVTMHAKSSTAVEPGHFDFDPRST